MTLSYNMIQYWGVKYKGNASSAARYIGTDESHLKYIVKCESACFPASAFLSYFLCSGISFILHFRKYYTTQH